MDELIVARATRTKDVIAKVINGTLIVMYFNHFAVVAAPDDVQKAAKKIKNTHNKTDNKLETRGLAKWLETETKNMVNPCRQVQNSAVIVLCG